MSSFETTAKRILVENLSYSYTPEEEPVLKEIHVELHQRSTAIIGQNGSGKTTFVKLLKGLLQPGSGNVFINGKNTRKHTPAQLAREIGLVFQNPDEQIFKRTVWAEVAFGPTVMGMDQSQLNQTVQESLEWVGLSERAEENPHDLGLSEKKLLCVASVVAMTPSILIMDEPTMGQDQEGMDMLRTVMQNLRQRGTLLITITHDMDFVAAHFDRVLLFKEGRLHYDGTPRDLFSQNSLLTETAITLPHITELGQQLDSSQTLLSLDEWIRWYAKKG